MFDRILVPLDSSRFAEAALGPAIAIARSSGGELALVLVHEFPLALPEGVDLVSATQHLEEMDYVDRFIQPLVMDLERQGIRATIVERNGRASDAILAYAEANRVDLIVLASHGRTGLGRLLLGSQADRLMHKAGCPILMVRPTEAGSVSPAPFTSSGFQVIAVPLDGSVTAEAVLPDAEALARSAGGRLVLLRVVAPVPPAGLGFAIPDIMVGSMLDEDATNQVVQEAEGYLARVEADIRGRGPIRIETQVHVALDAGSVLPGLVRNYGADLVAMTTHGRGASRLLVGSVADELLEGTECAVLMHRQVRRSAPTSAEVPVAEPVLAPS